MKCCQCHSSLPTWSCKFFMLSSAWHTRRSRPITKIKSRRTEDRFLKFLAEYLKYINILKEDQTEQPSRPLSSQTDIFLINFFVLSQCMWKTNLWKLRPEVKFERKKKNDVFCINVRIKAPKRSIQTKIVARFLRFQLNLRLPFGSPFKWKRSGTKPWNCRPVDGNICTFSSF